MTTPTIDRTTASRPVTRQEQLLDAIDEVCDGKTLAKLRQELELVDCQPLTVAPNPPMHASYGTAIIHAWRE